MSAHGVTGGCLCGAVRYRADGLVTHPTLCHCRSCRRACAAPVVAWVTFPTAGFVLERGEPGRFASSPGVQRTFCGACGTPLTYANARFPEEIDVTVGSLDEPEAFAPADHTWTSEALPWLRPGDGRPRFRRSRFEEP